MFTHTYFVPRPPRLGHDAVIRTTSQGLVQPHRLLLIPPIIPRLNLAVVPSITTNSPRLKLFSTSFVLLVPETQKLCLRLFLFFYSPFCPRGPGRVWPPPKSFSARKHSNCLPKIHKLNFKAFPPITANNPPPELFFPNFRIFNSKKYKNKTFASRKNLNFFSLAQSIFLNSCAKFHVKIPRIVDFRPQQVNFQKVKSSSREHNASYICL